MADAANFLSPIIYREKHPKPSMVDFSRHMHYLSILLKTALNQKEKEKFASLVIILRYFPSKYSEHKRFGYRELLALCCSSIIGHLC